MFKNISSAIVNSAFENGVIKNENKEESIYGLNAFLTLTINVISALAIGLLFHMLPETVLFIFVYKSLRKYIGGSHAKNARRCYISSCIIYTVVLACIKLYLVPSILTTIFTCFSMIILWIVAPVEAPKKPLDEVEYKVFKHRSHITIVVFLCIFLISHYIPSQYTYYYSNVIAVSIYAVTLFAIIGKIQLSRLQKSPARH